MDIKRIAGAVLIFCASMSNALEVKGSGTGFYKLFLVVDENDTVLSVKQKIYAQIGMPVSIQNLIFNSSLEDERTLAEYGINDSHGINLEERSFGISENYAGSSLKEFIEK